MSNYGGHVTSVTPRPGGSVPFEGAENGLSIDPVNGKVVLGTFPDDPELFRGSLLNSRWINTFGSFLRWIYNASDTRKVWIETDGREINLTSDQDFGFGSPSPKIRFMDLDSVGGASQELVFELLQGSGLTLKGRVNEVDAEVYFEFPPTGGGAVNANGIAGKPDFSEFGVNGRCSFSTPIVDDPDGGGNLSISRGRGNVVHTNQGRVGDTTFDLINNFAPYGNGGDYTFLEVMDELMVINAPAGCTIIWGGVGQGIQIGVIAGNKGSIVKLLQVNETEIYVVYASGNWLLV